MFSLSNRLKRAAWIAVWALLCRWTPKPFHQWRILVLRLFGAKIGRSNYIYPNARIWAPWLLQTGDVVTIGPEVEVYNPGGLVLGHHVIISQGAYICGATHDYNSADFTYLKKKITMAPYTWICAKAIVLPGVTCGEGSVLGAASLTSRDLLPWSVYAGNPARKVKERINFTAVVDHDKLNF
ncbi:MAG: putative colanic acid biosynthesis acetyltransferase [Citrobacter freundii]|nr:MAG: putative colanic acid biosynthesis acetyltransferase [Citrobacter freundii]